ncbi:16S rRNA (guanine(966)-N(2))-methyltransferase RsmD [Marininema mesophilum]|uniref:16S rRNA (Guanine(966)-N(2))-methyltransferase RsmD n=1 Tax=Marininema mesophilum TaxID=1048340 RepID=A0A1H2Q433_9BACL|nr:16S rRNA (guanine(966)-N(2))-methyltransferase RsmD [Marininema mesophilum]SDW01568.1 16S rRNA (guanine(966)-N(2))-methyltransferase RsmD [Marininema mesophilum]
MRIIAGSAKGTRLYSVQGFSVRPTTDRVKESLFQVIGPFFAGGWVLDLFAGSGSLGLEALSRGADRAIFIDQARGSIEAVRRNVKATRMEEKAEVYKRDARATLRTLKGRGVSFQLIFLDPPYKDGILPDIIQSIDEGNLLAEDGWLIAEHGRDETLPAAVGSLVQERTLTYGDIQIALFTREPVGEERRGGQ